MSVNASLRLSGDQSGWLASPIGTVPVAVNPVRLEPSAFITQISLPRLVIGPTEGRLESNAIIVASGDQTASPLIIPPVVSLVRGAANVPSALTTQMFWAPFVLAASLPLSARADEKTIAGGLIELEPTPPV